MYFVNYSCKKASSSEPPSPNECLMPSNPVNSPDNDVFGGGSTAIEPMLLHKFDDQMLALKVTKTLGSSQVKVACAKANTNDR